MQLAAKALICKVHSGIIISEHDTGRTDDMNIIRADKLTKQYGDFKAVNGISFSVEKGELLGFLGVNGAGKSTTINMLSTLIPLTSGSAEICGFDVMKNASEIRRRIGIVYQQNCLDDMLTVKENLICRGVLHGASSSEAKKRLTELADILSLSEFIGKRYKTLSGGQKRRCEIAAALMHTPDILFLDEPTTGLDPASRKDVWKTVDQLRSGTGMTVFLTTHYMEEAAGANRIIIIDKGAVRAEGTPFELKERYAYDSCRLYCSAEKLSLLDGVLRAMDISPRPEDYGVSFRVRSTVDALPAIEKVKSMISGFEVIQGNMDDVFLNAVGSTAEEGK